VTQAQVATRMGVGKSRISRIEKGRLSTRDVLDHYVEALGGRLSLMADTGSGSPATKTSRFVWWCVRPTETSVPRSMAFTWRYVTLRGTDRSAHHSRMWLFVTVAGRRHGGGQPPWQ
jgi:transcriptional regulator with XRE-family HTH domain